MTYPFRAHAQHYDKNHRESIAANVRPAIIEAPGGGEEAGVMVGIGGRVLLILTVNDAYRIATDIANILTDHRAGARTQT